MTDPLLLFVVGLVAVTLIYTVLLLALDRLLERVQQQHAGQRAQILLRAASGTWRLVVAYILVRQHLRRAGRIR